MSNPLTVDRIRRWLRELLELTATRGRDEAGIEQEYRRQRESETGAYSEQKGEVETRYQDDRVTIHASHSTAELQLKAQFEKADSELRRAEESERLTIVEKARHSARQAKKKWDEAVWAAETVYEAQEPLPRRKHKKTLKALDEHRIRLDGLEQQARMYMRRSRVTIVGEPTPCVDEFDEPQQALEEQCDLAVTGLEKLLRVHSLKLFQDIAPFFALVVPTAAVVTAVGFYTNQWTLENTTLIASTGGTFVGTLLLLVWLRFASRRKARTRFDAMRETLARGRRAYEEAVHAADRQRQQDEADLVATRDREVREARQTYEPILKQIAERRDQHMRRIEQTYPEKLRTLRENYERDLEEGHKELERRRQEVDRHYRRDAGALDERHGKVAGRLDLAHDSAWTALVRRWTEGIGVARQEAADIDAETHRLFAPWDAPVWSQWKPGDTFAPSVPFGRITVDMAGLDGGLPRDTRLDVAGPTLFEMPALLTFPDRCSLLVRSGPEGRRTAVQTLQAVMMRLLTTLPPGKVRFTIIDPIGLGQNFAGFMHLADYNEAFVGGKIWTETRHIEQRLADLTEHMENVIQKYLRNEYETIAKYNEAAGEIAEPYRFVVVCDFPTNFNDNAARRLASILSSGPKCGVYTLISLDSRQKKLPKGLSMTELTEHAVTLDHEPEADRFVWKDADFEPLPLRVESTPPESFVTDALKLVGESALDATRVEVPFGVVTPDDDSWWSLDSAREVKVPLGRSGATRLQNLVLGHGTNQHALIAGKTGSGKSTLLHVLVTNLAAWYAPDQVEFYLVDFKKGVEFKTYASHRLPHARAVAIESDREFGLSVLHRLDEELKQRGNLFRELGVQDLAGYRATGHDKPMPRTLLIIDEFQEFFVEDDKIGQDAALLLDRLVRQGRAFGVHVLLGSQTLGGAYTLARSTLGQMGVRIALQCSENDSYLILSDDNAGARLLSRPGEAIYNDANGQVEGNSPFQIVWLPDHVRDVALDQVSAITESREYVPPEPCIVFEGNAPADPATNHLLTSQLGGAEPPATPRVWLGEAVAIKDPSSVSFARQSGSNLLIIGQREESALSMMSVALVSLAAQCPADGVIYVLDGSAADAPHGQRLAQLAADLPANVRVVAWRDVERVIGELASELSRRQDDDDAPRPPVFVLINGLQRYRMLRKSDDDFSFSFSSDESGSGGGGSASPGKQLGDVLREGPPCGMHVLTWCDSVTNVERTFDRQGLREFDSRVLFQMSAADSTMLIDSAAASKLGLQRALLANEERGTLEKFRPYGLPSDEWLARVATQLRRDTPVVDVVTRSSEETAIDG